MFKSNLDKIWVRSELNWNDEDWICYKHIKIDKIEQDWSFNQFAMHASEFSA